MTTSEWLDIGILFSSVIVVWSSIGWRRLILSSSLTCFLLAAFGVLHHETVSGRWFDWEVLAHHEPLILNCIVAGISILVTHYLSMRRR